MFNGAFREQEDVSAHACLTALEYSPVILPQAGFQLLASIDIRFIVGADFPDGDFKLEL
jgi:hypothetical protein